MANTVISLSLSLSLSPLAATRQPVVAIGIEIKKNLAELLQENQQNDLCFISVWRGQYQCLSGLVSYLPPSMEQFGADYHSFSALSDCLQSIG